MSVRPSTPRGFRDVLPREAAEREAITSRVEAVFRSWGYEPVETPVVESLEVLEEAAGDLRGTAFRLFDADGSLLALRPDMTVPIARLTASHLPSDAGPHRFRYGTQVFREQESMQGQARQFTQLGVELIGSSGPVADAEVVGVLVEALRAAGLDDFTVAIGSVRILRALLDAAGDSAWADRVLAAVHARNLVGVDEIANAAADADVGVALRKVVRLRGGADAIAQCGELVGAWDGAGAAGELALVWRLLETAGVSDRVVVDFGVLRDFDYYTGLVVEAYANGLGVPLGGGGRYDGALGAYGNWKPAAGFALGLERLHIALIDQGTTPSVPRLDAVMGGDPEIGLEAAAALRRAGWGVALSGARGADLVGEAFRAGAMHAIEAGGDGLVVLADDGTVVRGVSLEDLIREGSGT